MGTLAELKHEPESDVTPIPLMQLATAFWGFKTLSTAVDMDLFTQLEVSPMNAPELARWLNIEERPAEMILTGCAGLGLLSKQNGRYRNTPLAETFLVRGGRYYFGGFVTMLNHRLYSGWDKLPQAMRTNRPTTWDPDKQKSLFEAADPEMMGTFWQAMHSLSTFTARELGDNVDFSRFRKLLEDSGFHFLFQLVDRLGALDLTWFVERGFDPIARDPISHFENILVHRHQRHLALRFAHLRREFLLDPNHLLGV